MKTTTVGMMITALLGAAPLAYASTASKDGSQLAIYIFLGMCALIVVVQLFPIIFLVFAFMKALVQGKKEAVTASAEVVNEK